MKRTTLALDDDLLQKLRMRAAREGRSMQAVANDLIRHSIALEDRPRAYHLDLKGWRRRPVRVDLLDRNALFDMMDGR